MKYLLLFLGATFLVHAKTIYIVPFGPTFAGSSLFNPEERDGTLVPFCGLKKAAEKLGYEIKAVYDISHLTDAAAIVFLNSHAEATFMKGLPHYNCPKILYLWEPPLHDARGYDKTYHQLFTKVFSLSSDQVDNKKVFKWFYPQPSLEMIHSLPAFDKRKLCTTIVGFHHSNHPQELYSERLKAIEFFHQFGPTIFEFYGGGWPSNCSPCYKGTVKNKAECLKNYRFTICYENTRDLPGYLTEKIFDCFVAGSIPVYWGDPQVTHYIPQDCFIDRRTFSSLHDLYHYLNNMSEAEHTGYLANIRRFLASSGAYRFSIDYFIDTFMSAVDPDYDRNLIFISMGER